MVLCDGTVSVYNERVNLTFSPVCEFGPYRLEVYRARENAGQMILTFLPISPSGPLSEEIPRCSCSFSSFVHVLLLYILLLPALLDAPAVLFPDDDPRPLVFANPPVCVLLLLLLLLLASTNSRSKARGVLPACSRIQLTSADVREDSGPVEKNIREVGVPLCVVRE